jgi:hypothetical protein
VFLQNCGSLGVVLIITSPPHLFYNTRQRRVHNNKQTTKTHA